MTSAATRRTLPPRRSTAQPTSWRPFLVLVAHDLAQLRKGSVAFAARIVSNTLTTVFVFDFLLPQLPGSGISTAGLATVLAPGLVAVTTCNQALTSTVMAMVFDFGPARRIDQTLMAPVPVPVIAVVMIIGGAVRGVYAAAITLPIVTFVHAPGTPPRIDLGRWPYLLAVIMVVGVLFASLGIVLGTTFDPAKAANILPYGLNIMIMTGCVFYPWSALEVLPWLQVLILANPVVFATESVRLTLAPQLDHMPAAVLTCVLGAGTVVMALTAMARFTARTRQ